MNSIIRASKPAPDFKWTVKVPPSSQLFVGTCSQGRRFDDLGGASLGGAARSQKFKDHRQNRYDDDRDDDQFEVLFDQFVAAEFISGGNAKDDPGDSSYHVVGEETEVGHLADAGDEGREGADNGDEAGKDNRFAAIFFVELVSAFQVLAVHQSNQNRFILGDWLIG